MNLKIKSLLSVFIFLLASGGVVNAASNPPDEKLRIERLASLCRLWGKVKYFHPSLPYRADIDWDKALIETIPKVNVAKDTAEYKAAVQNLLNVLGDPATGIVENQSTTINDNRQFQYKFDEDGVLTITAGNYFELFDQTTQAKLNAVLAEIPKARAVIFDLRSGQPLQAYSSLALTSSFSQIERLISKAPLITPGERSLIYRGFENPSAFSSGQYKSGFYIQDGKRIIFAQNAKDIPAVFLLNENSGLLDSTIALQAAGKALIVFEGNANRISTGIKTEMIDLGEGISAQIRLTEPILEDGTSGGLQPDVIVPVSPKDSDKALETALTLARNFKSSGITRRKLPSITVFNRDKSYPQMNTPSFEYRLLAVFRVWNIIEHFFPHKSLIGEDWNAVLREFIPKIEQSKNALEYSLTIAEMMTHIHDSHVYIAGSAMDDYFGTGYPPIRVRLIENSLVVTHFYDETIAKSSGLQIGDIVLKVDGEDAKTRLARYEKYISASTPQNRTDKATLAFMNGADKSVVTLTVRDRNNREKQIVLPRKYEDVNTLYHRERSGEILKLLPGNIGYADLDRMSIEMIDEMFEKFKTTKAIIFDLRGYPNGLFFWYLTPRLTEKQNVAATLLETPLISQFSPENSTETTHQMIQPTPPGKFIYKGKTVMLIDERSISQSEHTGLFFRTANGTKYIGSPTAGADGEIATFNVPGGITIGFTAQSVRYSDGKQLQRVGLVPDVSVKPTIKGVREGRDEVLEKAVNYLRSADKKSSKNILKKPQ